MRNLRRAGASALLRKPLLVVLAVGLAATVAVSAPSPARADLDPNASLKHTFITQVKKVLPAVQQVKAAIRGNPIDLYSFWDHQFPLQRAARNLRARAAAAESALRAEQPTEREFRAARAAAISSMAQLQRAADAYEEFWDKIGEAPAADVRDFIAWLAGSSPAEGQRLEGELRDLALRAKTAMAKAKAALERANNRLGRPFKPQKINKAGPKPLAKDTPLVCPETSPRARPAACPVTSAPEVPNLAGQWLGQDGGRYTLTQASGSSAVSWSACDSNGGTLWSHTFSGTITGGYLVGTFVDGPPGTLRNSGTLVLAIQGTGSLSWVASATIDGKTYTSFPTLTRQWSRGGHGGCPGLGSGFAITSVSLPATITGGGPTGNLAVSWTGNPTFPVTVVYTPDACPPGWGCSTPTMTFATHANPLVFPGAVWCTRISGPPVFFDYSVYLEDATGKRTARRNADFTCLPS